MPETTELRVELPSDEKEMTQANGKMENQGIVDKCLAKGQCSRGESCSFRHDITKKGKGIGKRDRPRSLSRPRSPKSDSNHGKGLARGKVPKGTSPYQPSCCSYLRQQRGAKQKVGKRTRSSKRRPLPSYEVLRNWVVYLRTSSCHNKRLDFRA